MALEDTIINIGLTIGVILGVLVMVALVSWGAFMFWKRQKRYQEFKCIIWERDGFGQLKETIDGAGIFVDMKTKNKRLFLKKNNVGLRPDNIPYIQSGKQKIIYMFKTGLKNLHFIRVNIKEPAVTLTVGEEDVNWGINAYERAKKMFSSSTLMQLMPYIALIFVSMIILILFVYLFRQFGTLKEAFEAARQMVDAINAGRGGTTVIQ